MYCSLKAPRDRPQTAFTAVSLKRRYGAYLARLNKKFIHGRILAAFIHETAIKDLIAVFPRLSSLILILPLVIPSTVSLAGDYWPGQSGQGAASNNDCGFISAVSGSPVIHRAFMAGDDPGVAAFAADRLNAGDEVRVPAGGSLELIAGNNIIVVLGSGARVKFSGLRTLAVNDPETVTRLDAQLLAGGIRIQVRLNERRPEAAWVSMAGAEALLVRGDVEISSEGGWHASVLAGSAELRLRRAGMTGAPFTLREGMKTGIDGEGGLNADEVAAIRRRLPFSFETSRAALPPHPASGALLEAP